jgi:hypothetical protein
VLVLRHKIADSIVFAAGLKRAWIADQSERPATRSIGDGTFVTEWGLAREFRGTDVSARCRADYKLISSRRRFLGSMPKINTTMISIISNATSIVITPPTP